jgi:hypothetical protein
VAGFGYHNAGVPDKGKLEGPWMPDTELHGLDDFLGAQEADQLRFLEGLPQGPATALWNAIVARSESAGEDSAASIRVLGRILERAAPREYADPAEVAVNPGNEPAAFAGGLFAALSASLTAAPAATLNEGEVPEKRKDNGVPWVKRHVTALLNWFERRGLREKAAAIPLKDMVSLAESAESANRVP